MWIYRIYKNKIYENNTQKMRGVYLEYTIVRFLYYMKKCMIVFEILIKTKYCKFLTITNLFSKIGLNNKPVMEIKLNHKYLIQKQAEVESVKGTKSR